MRTRIALIAGAAVLAGVAACASTSKTCTDGVCKITENGKVRYEGPPDKVAAMQAKDNAAAARQAEILQAYDSAPRRGADEVIRVALLSPGAGNQELAKHAQAFDQMLRQEFGDSATLKLVEPRIVQQVLSAKPAEEGGGGSHMTMRTSSGSANEETAEQRVARLRDSGLDVDVVVFTQLAPKTQTGIVSGKGGSGVAQVEHVELQGNVSSIYKFAENRLAEEGKSTNGLSVAGVDKKGKASNGELKTNRNIEHDRPAVQRYVAAIKQLLSTKIGPTLPSTVAVAEIHNKYQIVAPQAQPSSGAEGMRKLFGK